jgi:hypothetical protein
MVVLALCWFGKDHVEVVEALLQKGADVHAKDSGGPTPSLFV